MPASTTQRVSSLLSAAAVAVVVAIVACPGKKGSKSGQPTLLSVAVTPTNPTIALGTAQPFTATGTYSDGKTLDLTALAGWSSSDSSKGEVSTAGADRGLASSTGVGSTTITATYAGVSGSTTLTVSSAEVVAIEVTPTNPSIALGTSQAFAATAILTDGTTQDLTAQVAWESSASGTSTISNDAASSGLALGVGVGDATITATRAGVSGSTQLSVTSARLVAIDVTPTDPSIALGTSQEFAATGEFTDGTTQDLTAEVAWESSESGAATISNDDGSRGVARSVAVGATAISATHSGITGSTTLSVSSATLVSIALTPAAPEIVLGATQAFTASGTFTDGSVQDVTAEAVWTSSQESVSVVANVAGEKGVASSLATGTTTISAELAGVVGSTTLAVGNAVLASIEVTPSHPSAALGTTQAFAATGIYTDGSVHDVTADATWSTSDSAVATVSNAGDGRGRATTLAVGSATITASLYGESGSTSLSVSPAELVAIAVSPDSATLAAGISQAFTALGILSDGTRQDLTEQVTWSSSDDSIATVSGAAGSHGLVSGLSVGSVTVSAELAGLGGSAAVEISPATLDTLDVTPFSASIAKGTALQLSAMGNYSDGTTRDLTAQVTWSTSSAGVAAVSNAAGTRGLATGTAVGAATITAELSGVAESMELAVTAALLESIELSPASPSLPAGMSLALVATGSFSDATTQDVTDLVTWSSSDAAVATVSNAAGSRGLARGVSAGAAEISASLSGRSAATTLSVTSATLVSLSVSPVEPSVPAGYALTLRALGHYSDGSSQDMSSLVLWSSSNAAVATISNSAGTEGRVNGLAPGAVTLSASLGTGAATTFLTVTSETLTSIVVEPSVVSLAVGETRQMSATGHFSGGSVVDVTAQAKWQVTPRSVAAVTNSTSKGLVTAKKAGNTTIRASQGARTATAALSVFRQ